MVRRAAVQRSSSQEAPRESDVISFDNWEAEVREGVRVVVVRGESQGGLRRGVTTGLATAQSLDLMAMRGGNNLVTKGFEDDHLVGGPSQVTW